MIESVLSGVHFKVVTSPEFSTGVGLDVEIAGLSLTKSNKKISIAEISQIADMP